MRETLWRRKNGDQQRRKYDFSYDAANRLTGGAFSQYASGSGSSAVFNTSAGIDFSVSGLSYDANGNILGMTQKGLKLNASPIIDQLTYTYNTKSNKLLKVVDAITADNKLGDFNDGSNGTANDYTYDVNGNLNKDNNKKISSITYNHLNLPQVITITGKGTITYTYDALGSKLKKTTVETPSSANGNKTITTTTLYQGGFVYESKTISPADPAQPNYTDKLLFTSHEEGRIRALYNNPSAPNTPTGFVYDYFLKDHLGNIRMVLTDEYKQDIYPAATLEGSLTANGSPNAAYIEKNYYTINGSYIVNKPSAVPNYPNKNGGAGATDPPVNPNPNSVVTANSAKMYRLNSSNTSKMGLGITLKVMAGDRIDIYCKSFWSTATGGPGGNVLIPAIDILTGLLSGPTGGIAGVHGVTGSQLSGWPNTTSAITALQSLQNTAVGNTTIPRAFVNYLFFDERFGAAKQGCSRVKSTAGQLMDHFTQDADNMQNIIAPKNGYVYIYVSNESPVDVFFDNLQVIHTRGQILEETHYYPFGLTMAGISSKALNNAPENKRKYNGIEFNEDLDLDIYDAYYRNLDPQTARWWQIDPETDGYESISPYASMYDNPLKFSDPLGNEGDDCCGGIIDGLVQLGKDAVTFTVAAANAFVTNQAGGIGRGDPNSFSDPHDGAVARAGATFGDVLTLGGTAGVTAGSIVVEAGTIGFASPAVLPVLGQQYLVAAPTAIKNIANDLSGSNKVNSTSNSSSGRSGKQQKLKEIANDPKAGKSDKGWIKQEQNAIERGDRKNIRVPPGKNLAHDRGKEARKGYTYKDSKLQDIDLHKTQHRVERKVKRNNRNE